MQVVITTQIRENYGSAEAPHWKCKGGDTYIVPNLTESQVNKVKANGIPTLTSLITSMNPMYEEYVIGFDIVEDGADVCEPWDSPFKLFYENGRWVCRQLTDNTTEYGYMNKKIAQRVSEYVMLSNGQRDNHTVTYVMVNGDVVLGENFNEYIAMAA